VRRTQALRPGILPVPLPCGYSCAENR
jgi:hypothetical protein